VPSDFFVKTKLFIALVRAAQKASEDLRVPYAFEKRVMSKIRALDPEDLWNVWLPIMRKAALCGLGIVVLTLAYVRYAESRSPDLLAGDLERTVLASVDTDETW